jgi:hypothetical protein
VRSASEWAQARAMAADGLSQREVAARLGINRRTVRRMLDSSGPPRCQRAPRGSMLDPLEPVLRRLLRDWPEIKTPRVTEILHSDHGYTAPGSPAASAGSTRSSARCPIRARSRRTSHSI